MADDLWLGEDLKEIGLGFLYYRCKKIKHGMITRIKYTPEYVEALKEAAESGVVFDDALVFKIIQKVWVDELSAREHNYTAKRTIQGISRNLYGDPHAWKYK